VVQCDKRRNISGQQIVNQTIIKVQTSGIHLTATLRQNAWPGNGEAICSQSQAIHQLSVFFNTVVVVSTHLSTMALVDFTWSHGKIIPDRSSSTIFTGCTFNLIGRSCSPPEEILRKASSQVRLARVPVCVSREMFMVSPFLTYTTGRPLNCARKRPITCFSGKHAFQRAARELEEDISRLHN